MCPESFAGFRFDIIFCMSRFNHVPSGDTLCQDAISSLKFPLYSYDRQIVRKSLTGLVCMTATYDGDQFENVDRLMDCSVLPQIVEMIGSSQTSLNATALLLASNLAYSGRKAVVKVR